MLCYNKIIMFYTSSVAYIFSAFVGFIFGLKNFQAFRKNHNWYSKIWSLAIPIFALGLLSFGIASLIHNKTVYKLALIAGYIFLFLGFDCSFRASFKYLNLKKIEIVTRLLFFFWIIPIVTLYALNFADPIVDKYGFIFWNYKFPLNWIAFLFVFSAALINFLVYLKIARDSQKRLFKLRFIFLGLAFLFAGCGGAFTSFTNLGNYYSIIIAYSSMPLGFICVLLAVYYKRAELKRNQK